jgi:hypothetical protein
MEPFPPTSRAAHLLAEISRANPRFRLIPRGTSVPRAVLEELEDLSLEALLGGRIADRDLASAVRAGLLLRADFLEESHRISQGIATAEGRYWHGILHRREPDYANAKHWFRRVVGEHGEHSVLGALAREPIASRPALEGAVRGGRIDPLAVVDLCESCERSVDPQLRGDLETFQERETLLLLEHCARGALERGRG